MIWRQTSSPGNEQADYWGSAAAKREASRNYAGIADRGVDKLVERAIFAKDQETLVAATKGARAIPGVRTEITINISHAFSELRAMPRLNVTTPS
ncbi:hypothetical protein [Sinorhizobium saheli]|uniref:Uncharacterized protein n=1 Tax=Sinorhizobium saheli TaxID=36856 RepID=A0A178XXW0_SINSA|nr:hypothetical protein [Sinorhizobium saheli]MQW86351.1 hypothetical protein [Sinorhizobium saheli]OAP39652.1 hypothetical protein ATB98_04855 [Sinorhizobium saheli]